MSVTEDLGKSVIRFAIFVAIMMSAITVFFIYYLTETSNDKKEEVYYKEVIVSDTIYLENGGINILSYKKLELIKK